MPAPRPLRRRVASLVVATAVVTMARPALAQEGSTTTVSPSSTVASQPAASSTTVATGGASTTTTTMAPDPNDPTAVEGVQSEPVPVVDVTVPQRTDNAGEAARLVRQELRVAQANAVKSGLTYVAARTKAIALEAEVDRFEDSVAQLSTQDRDAVRRVAATKRYFEARAATAIVRGRIDDIAPSAVSDDPNDVAVGKVLLGSVLQEDDKALQQYLAARQSTGAVLADMADQLVAKRAELAAVKGALIDARRANVAARINLQFFSAGSEIVIQGFVFPVGTPNNFGDSFGAPRMVGTEYSHAHQGTDIMAPRGTPILACERGIIARIGTDVLGGNKLYLKGESGTYYYYAHLERYADSLANGQVVDAGQVLGYVGDTGNAKGGPTHLHFEIHPDGGRAVNPYALLKVVKQLNHEAGGN
jgi:murein DD-endopeptidase MepM/ murein hydrolase activator NlpD